MEKRSLNYYYLLTLFMLHRGCLSTHTLLILTLSNVSFSDILRNDYLDHFDTFGENFDFDTSADPLTAAKLPAGIDQSKKGSIHDITFYILV